MQLMDGTCSLSVEKHVVKQSIKLNIGMFAPSKTDHFAQPSLSDVDIDGCIHPHIFKGSFNKKNIQGGPLLVINGVVTHIYIATP